MQPYYASNKDEERLTMRLLGLVVWAYTRNLGRCAGVSNYSLTVFMSKKGKDRQEIIGLIPAVGVLEYQTAALLCLRRGKID